MKRESLWRHPIKKGDEVICANPTPNTLTIFPHDATCPLAWSMADSIHRLPTFTKPVAVALLCSARCFVIFATAQASPLTFFPTTNPSPNLNNVWYNTSTYCDHEHIWHRAHNPATCYAANNQNNSLFNNQRGGWHRRLDGRKYIISANTKPLFVFTGYQHTAWLQLI